MAVWIADWLLLLALMGASYQFVGMVLDRKHFSPPGRLINVGGHRLHLSCIVERSPTVLLEAAAPS
jgi:hypothetical protein